MICLIPSHKPYAC